MTRPTFLALCLLGIAAPARAEESQPAGMPNPREMSGIPRPDDMVAQGALTVRILQGDFAHSAAQGTRAALVEIKTDGAVRKIEARTDDVGRVEYKDLVTDGSAVYYALCLFGEDRLASLPITLPPRVGVRVMLVGRSLSESGVPQGKPIDAAAQPEAQTTEDEPLVFLPAGQVKIEAGGRVSPGLTVSLEEIGVAGARTALAQVGSAPNVVLAEFHGVQGGPEHIYIARVVAAGRTYLSRPLQLAAARGAKETVFAYDRLLIRMHAAGQVDDNKLWFEAQFTLANPTGVPYDTGPSGLELPLPVGFRTASVPDEAMATRVKIVEGEGIVYRGAVAPGQHEFVVQWALGTENGRARFDLEAPYGLVDSQVIVDHVPGSTLTPPPGHTPRQTTLDSGRVYDVLSGLNVTPGERLRWTLDELPQASQKDKIVRVTVGLFVLALLLWALSAALRAPAPPAPLTPAALGARRETLYDELLSLSKRHASQELTTAAFERERTARLLELEALCRDLEDNRAPKSTRAP